MTSQLILSCSLEFTCHQTRHSQDSVTSHESTTSTSHTG